MRFTLADTILSPAHGASFTSLEEALSLQESLLTPVAHVLVKPSAAHALLLEINLLSSSGQTSRIPGLVEKAIYFYSLPPLNQPSVLAFSERRLKFAN